MSFAKYARKRLWELAFASLAAACVGVCLAEGFVIPAELEGRFFPAFIICLALSALALAFSYCKKSAIVGVCLLVCGIAAAFFRLSRGAGAPELYALVVCFVGLFVFFMSRTRVGAALVIALGTLVITGEMLFQYGSHPALLVLFLFASCCLLLSRIYGAGMLRSSTRSAAYSRHALLCITACFIAAGLAGGVYFAVIRPLSPPSYDIELKTRLQKLPILEKIGVASRIYLPDPGKKTDNSFESDSLSDYNGDTGNGEAKADKPIPNEGNSSFSARSLTPLPAEAITYLMRDYVWGYALCFVLLAAASVAGRLVIRRRRFLRIMKMPICEQISEFYSAVLNAMASCGLPPIGSDSPTEYCGKHEKMITQFLGEGSDFSALTKVFERAYYGQTAPSEAEYGEYMDLYKSLPGISRRSAGALKYAVMFFRAKHF